MEKSFYGKEIFEVEGHLCHLTRQATFEREFDWNVHQVGLLHLEMNDGRSFVHLNWYMFIQKVIKTINFTNECALLLIKKGTDHHKLWIILEIVYAQYPMNCFLCMAKFD